MAEHPVHVQQAYNELDNGLRTGSQDAVTAARKRLDAAGVDGEQAVAKARARRAADLRGGAMRGGAGDDEQAARATAPQGRTTKAAARAKTT